MGDTLVVPVWAVVVALAVAAVAAVTDVRSRRVPNWLTATAVLMGIAAHALNGGFREAIWSLSGALVGGALLLPLVLAGWVGAGDMKLLMALGAVGGWRLAVASLMSGTLLGAVASLFILAYLCRRSLLHRALGVVMLVGVTSLRQALKSFGEPLKVRLPFAAFLGGGAVIGLIGGWLGAW